MIIMEPFHFLFLIAFFILIFIAISIGNILAIVVPVCIFVTLINQQVQNKMVGQHIAIRWYNLFLYHQIMDD